MKANKKIKKLGLSNIGKINKKINKIGDRRDGTLIRDLDPLHYFTGILYPNRCDNEAYVSETIDLYPLNEYVKAKNQGETGADFPYTMFHCIVTAMVKTITLRPKMNRFIVRGNFYQRNEVSAAFVVKKQFTDAGKEALAFLHLKDDDNLDSIHNQIKDIVTVCRSEDNQDSSSDSMDFVGSLPRFVSKGIAKGSMILDRYGLVPQSFVETDPYYSSVVLSNLGSIKMKSGYHHLTNWGTCSVFCIVGEKKKRPVFADDGTFVMRETLDLGITIDERLADGVYYSKSVKMLKYMLEHPDLLDEPLNKDFAMQEK